MKRYQWDPGVGKRGEGERVGGEWDDVRWNERGTCGGNDGSAGLVRRAEGMGVPAVKVEHGASHSSHRGPPKKSIQTKHRSTFWHIVMCYSFWLQCPPMKPLLYVNLVRHFSRLKSMYSKDWSRRHTHTHVRVCARVCTLCNRIYACLSVINYVSGKYVCNQFLS